METNSLPPGQVTGNAPFYKKPEPLNPADHGKLGLRSVENPYAFGKTQHFVPLLATEFIPAALCYPIIFAGDELTPLAVMGLNQGENLFYDGDVLRADAYIPAYVRRYPFIVAGDETGERMVVCIDRESHLIGEDGVTRMFENGELTQYSKDCIQFCENFEFDRQRTMQLVAKLKELDLFEPRDATWTPPTPPGQPPAEPQRLAGFMAISEAKLNALPNETYIELRTLGYLQAIFAHQISQYNWDRLISLSIGRRMAEDKAKAAKAKKN